MRGDMMAACWETRGCDGEMQSRCPHNQPDEPCPADCFYAACERPTHVVTDDFELLLNPARDYDAATKEICKFCEFFLTNGPDREQGSEAVVRPGKPNRFLL